MSEINPENVCTVYYAVLGLLQGLNECHDRPINFDEQIEALEQLAQNIKSSGARIAALRAIQV